MGKWVLIVVAGLSMLGTCFGAGLMVGALLGEGGAYNRRYAEERDAIAPLLAADPAFAGLRMEPQSSGGAQLYGVVPTRADLDRLRERVTRAVGEGRAREVLFGVSTPK